MQEIELKFQVPPARRAALAVAVAGRQPAPRVRLQAIYFDTAGRALAQSGMALRLRKEGRQWVQTLKGPGRDGMTRFEHNVALPPGVATESVDPARHAGTEPGDRLLALLQDRGEALIAQYRTDILRRTRRLRARLGTVELAFDEGAILAGGRRLPVCELEIESVSGSPRAVVEAARGWVARHGLWLDTRTKAERGDLLARGQGVAPCRKAPAVRLSADADLPCGVAAALESCLEQITVNASQVASGDYDGEHVHQLRVGLRRLRSLLRFHEEAMAALPRFAEVTQATAEVFRALGAARDQVAIGEPIRAELNQALQAAGMRFQAPGLPVPPDATPPDALVRAPGTQALLLDLLAWRGADFPPAGMLPPSLREAAAAQLRRWHRKTARLAQDFATLDDPGRHTLRKRIKRLRYAVEFVADAWPRRRVRRYLKPLRALQERLGALMDVTVALDLYRGSSEGDPHALFAVGWLQARKEALATEVAAGVPAFVEAKRFWKKR